MRCTNCRCEFDPTRSQVWHAKNGSNILCSRTCQNAWHPRATAITHGSQTKSIREWEVLLGFPRSLLSWRLRAGWSIERALETPYVPRSRGVQPRPGFKPRHVVVVRAEHSRQ